jgi:hypothetical protein
MKQILINSHLVILTILVLLLSMGVNISKMRCDKAGTLYLGTQVPSCSEENAVLCNKEQEKVSCCMIEVQKSCCPETNDNSCASSTQNIHYAFETILTVFDFDFSEKPSLLSFFNSHDSKSYFVKVNNYFSGIPPTKLNKPILAGIQSFLL